MGSFSPPTPEPEPADAGNPLADARVLVDLGDSDDDLTDDGTLGGAANKDTIE